MPANNLMSYVGVSAGLAMGIAGAAAAGYYIYSTRQDDGGSSSSSGTFYTGPDDVEEFFSCNEDWQDNAEEYELYENVDRLVQDESGVEEAFSRMKKNLNEDMLKKANFLWRLAQVHYLKLKLPSKTQEEILFREGMKYAEAALEEDNKNAEAHKWFAIFKGLEGERKYEPRERIKCGLEFFQYINMALELRPKDWSLHYLLGRFKYEMAQMSAWQRKLVAVFSKELPKFSYSDARKEFEIAEKGNPMGSKANKLFMARCLAKEGKIGKALEKLSDCLKIPERTTEDKAYHKDAEKLKKDLEK